MIPYQAVEEFCTPETRLLCCTVKTCVSCAAVIPVCPLQGAKVVTFRDFWVRKRKNSSRKVVVSTLSNIGQNRPVVFILKCAGVIRRRR